ncbi:hypothetical protein AYI68_g6431, partial [Smittium mucronatum]
TSSTPTDLSSTYSSSSESSTSATSTSSETSSTSTSTYTGTTSSETSNPSTLTTTEIPTPSTTSSSSSVSTSSNSSSTEVTSTSTGGSTTFSSSSSVSQCPITSDYPSFSITSSPNNKMYDLNNPLILPCPGSDFTFEFSVSSSTDIYAALSDSQGYYSPNGTIEAYIGYVSNKYTIRKAAFVNTNTKRSFINKRDESHSVKLVLSNGIFTVYVDGISKVQYNVNTSSITQIYLAPFQATAVFSDIFISCNSFVDCPISLTIITSATSTSATSSTTLTSATSTSATSTSATSTSATSTSATSTSATTTSTTSTSATSTSTTSTSVSSTDASSNSCSSSSIVDCILISNDNSTQDYSKSNPITVPCLNSDFVFTSQIASDSDIFIALSDDISQIDSNGYVEVQVGLFSGSYLIQVGKIFTFNMQNINGKTSVHDFTLSYTNQVLSVIVDGKNMTSLSISNFSFKNLSISPIDGVVSLIQGSFVCKSDSC